MKIYLAVRKDFSIFAPSNGNRIYKIFFIMTNHIKIVLIVLISIMGLTACEKAHDTDISTLQNRPIKRVLNIDDFPKTDPTALTQLMNKDEDILCPAIVRMVASYEMLEGGYNLLNQLRSDEMYYTGDNEYMLNHEYETVKLLLENGYSITLIPPMQIKGMNTPDIMFDGIV